MANIIIGSFNPTRYPSEMTMIRAEKFCAHVLTYSSVAYFTWGTSIKGKEVVVQWPLMLQSEFDSLDTLFQANAAIVFNPNTGSGKTYNAEITKLDGKYFMFHTSGTTIFRKDVAATLLILSEV
jgi:hypothetical protein